MIWAILFFLVLILLLSFWVDSFEREHFLKKLGRKLKRFGKSVKDAVVDVSSDLAVELKESGKTIIETGTGLKV